MKLTSLFSCVLAFLMVTPCASAFTFPEPDWGALLAERRTMVKTAELELYAEGTPDMAPYYGAKLEPRSGVYFGMVASTGDFLPEKPSSYLTYFDLEYGQTDIYYPDSAYINNDPSGMVTIGWTVHDIQNVDAYMDVIRQGLDTLASYDRPMFIRFANEMNVSILGDDPTAYVDAFRKVADLIHQYPNFAVVWAPNDRGALDRPFSYYYPGDEYVDWIGVSSYMLTHFRGNPNTTETESIYFMTGDYAWHTNTVKPIFQFLRENNIQKPVMISEGGVANATALGQDTTVWAIPRLRNMYWDLIMEYPQIKMINYFNVYQKDEWEFFNLNDTCQEILSQARLSGAYIDYPGDIPEFSYVKADWAGTLSGDVINLYTHGYLPNSDYNTVVYRIDGAFYHSSDTAPYTCGYMPSRFSDGQHTLEIILSGGGKTNTRTYTFHQMGNSIRFGGEPVDPPAPPAKTVNVFFNGNAVAFDVPPTILQDRTMVPIRKFANAIGIPDENISYEDFTRTAVLVYNNSIIRLQIDNPAAFVDGTQTLLDAPATIVAGRTLVPLRFISETFGCNVSYTDDGSVLNVYLSR